MAGDCISAGFPGDGTVSDEGCFRQVWDLKLQQSTGGDCIYENNLTGADNAGGATCLLTPDPITPANAGPQCNAGSEAVGVTPTAGRGKIMVPGFLITPVTPDALGDVTPFWAGTRPEDLAASASAIQNVRGNPRFYIRNLIKIDVDPCHGPIVLASGEIAGDNQAFCSLDDNTGIGSGVADPAGGFWLTRIFFTYLDNQGWSMQCNRPINIPIATATFTPPQQENQQGDRRFEYTTRKGILGFVHFTTGLEPACAQMQDQFCLTDSCDTNVWGCDRNSHRDPDLIVRRRNAWATFRFDPDVSYSTDADRYPHPTGYIETLNQAWKTFRMIHDNWQVVKGGAGGSFGQLNPNRWGGGYGFHDATEGAGGIPNSSVPTHPIVRQGDGTVTQEPVEVTIKSRLTALAIPAQWHIESWGAALRLNLEQGPLIPASGRTSFRIGTMFTLFLNLRVRPIDTPENRDLLAAYGFRLADDDAFWADGDLRVLAKADPTDQADPTLEHRQESLYPVGASGERIPHQRPSSQEILNEGLLLWRGMIGPQPYAVGDYEFRQGDSPNDNTEFGNHSSYKCCESQMRSHGLVIPGEVNDFADPLGSQVMTGDVAIVIPQIATKGSGWDWCIA